jgi:hypothetical protein
MKTGALVLGIIGGLIALLYGLLGYGIGSLADVGEAGSGGGLKFLSIGLPVVALIGAGTVKAKPAIGAALMGISAVGFVMVLGFNFFSMIPVVILGLAALFGFMSLQDPVK